MREWEIRFGNLSGIPYVRWFEGECLRYESRDDCVEGMTMAVLSPVVRASEIHLLLRDRYTETAMVHEVVHWALYETDGDADSGHSDPLWDVQEDVWRALQAWEER